MIPVAQNPGEKPATIDAKWSKQAVFDFLPHGNDEMTIKAATFTGDVVITHPQLGLTAQLPTECFDRRKAQDHRLAGIDIHCLHPFYLVGHFKVH